MSVSQHTTSELPYYCKVDSITDTTITYRMLFLKPNVKQESEKRQPRVWLCCIPVLVLIVIRESYINCGNLCKLSGRFVVTSNVDMAVHIEAPHASGTVGIVVSILQVFIIFVQYYSLARYFLASKREGWKLKGRGYDLSFGPAHTYTFDPPPVDSGLNVSLPSKDSDDVHVSGHIEKVSLEGQREW